jgi:hypothetical protein
VSLTMFTEHCPLLLESDTLSLSPSFVLQGKILRDVPVGAAHRIQPPGDIILSALQYGITFRSLHGLAEEMGITQTQLIDVLGFLNSAGALRRRRTMRGHVIAIHHGLVHAPTGIIQPALTWRYRFSRRSLAIATLRASWPVIASATAVCIIAVAGSVIDVRSGLFMITYGVPLFVVSIYLHELAHASAQ